MKYLIILLGISLCSIVGKSQSGPGGVGNTSSNGLWLKADNISQANNTAVATWSDVSGNGNDAAQSSTTIQPIFLTTSSINGMPVVRFDGTDDEMAVADDPILDGTAGITFYAVIRPNNLNGSPRGILGKRITFTDPSNYAYTWFFWSSNRLYLDINTNNNRFNTGTTTFSNATNYILAYDFDGTLASSVRGGIRNSNTTLVRSTEASAVMSNSNQNLAIGALNEGYGQYLGADYAEIIHFNYALDTVDHILVQNYLSAKYSISIGSSDLYDEDDATNGNYDFDVAGIGQVSATEFNDDAQGSGIVRISGPSDLDNDEFLIWGHDNGAKNATEIGDVPSGVQARFERVWRVSEVNGLNTSVDVGSIDISFDLSGLGDVTPSDLRLLIDTDNDGVFTDETPISGGTSIGGDVYQFSGVSGISNNLRFTLGTINSIQTPLPIELLSFNARLLKNETVQLDWQTASEINNDYFDIERSQDAVLWGNLTTVKGAGNSSTLLKYNALDETPYQGTSYYRLKQVDFDGQFSYSDIKSVEIDDVDNTVLIYPNPALNQITISGNETELNDIRIYNVLGQDVTKLTSVINGSERKLILEIANLTAGVYVVKTKSTTNNVYKH